MDHDNNNKSGQFDASLKLPDEDVPASEPKTQDDPNPAADLIRKKVEAAYQHEPDAEVESEDIKDAGKANHHSKHQDFIYNLTSSGRPLHEIQTAWHEYYAGLTDAEKHKVWQEFYATHAQAAHHPALTHAEPAPAPPKPAARRTAAQKVKAKTKAKLAPAHHKTTTEPAKRKSANPLRSLLFGLGTGGIVILIFMFTFFNDRIIAPFIQPSRTATNIPIISSAPVSQAPEVIIPKINSEVPVVYDVNSVNNDDIQLGLERGVVHYADSALPGQDGNVVIVGHSSGNIFNAGNYKFAFSLLRALDTGDTFFLQKDGIRYTYQIYNKMVVKPTDVAVLGPTDKLATATLITCDPPGLNSNRLVVVAQQISPDPAANNTAAVPHPQVATATAIIPGNSPTLWSRLVKWFEQ